METKYFVAEAYRYAVSHNWEFKAVNSYNTLYEAKNAYHARKAAITKDSNDFVMVILFDMFGNRVMSDFDDTHVEPVPPEPSEGE
jgi:hypothetical protein